MTDEQQPTYQGKPDAGDTELIGVCTECGSDQPDAHMIRSPFFHAGQSVPCKWCKAPTALVERGQKKSMIQSLNKKRGVSHGD